MSKGFAKIIKCVKNQGMSDSCFQQLIEISDVVKNLIYHILDNKAIKSKIQEKDFQFIEQNIQQIDGFFEKVIALVIKLQKILINTLFVNSKSPNLSRRSPLDASAFQQNSRSFSNNNILNQINFNPNTNISNIDKKVSLSKFQDDMKTYMEDMANFSRQGPMKFQNKGDVTLQELLAVQKVPSPKNGKKKAPQLISMPQSVKFDQKITKNESELISLSSQLEKLY